MKEKEEEKENDQIKNGEVNTITTSKSNNLLLDNNIIISDPKDIYKTFECELISGSKLNRVNLIIDMQKKSIEIKLSTNNKKNKEKDEKINDEDNYIEWKKIDQIDFVGFLSQGDIKEEKVNEIKNNITINQNDKDKGEDKLLSEKEICSLTYFPLISKSDCNFCKCLFCCDCKCKNKYRIREYFTNYFLIQTDYILQIKKCIYEISLPKLNELQAKNRKRKFLAFVNPIGGKGNALTLWAKAKSIFEQTDIEITEIITSEHKQAYNHVLKVDPMEYDGFIACSGDGIIHEIINAIFHHSEEDKNKFLERCAICTLPAGSGNALSKAISYYSGYYLIKGKKKKVDIQELELKGVEKKIYSVVAFMYGFLADCDLDSECLRCIGMFRTTLMGAVRFFCPRDYFGCLYYLPEDATENDIKDMPNINTIPEAKGGTKWPLFRFLVSDMDTGDYFTNINNRTLKAGYDYFKTRWWRFIPKRERNDPDDVNREYNWNTYYSIDGERYGLNPIQCRTIKQLFSIYSGKE